MLLQKEQEKELSMTMKSYCSDDESKEFTKEAIITNYFSKYQKKKVKQSVKFCKCTNENILDYPYFSTTGTSFLLY
jgi:hypothetical protein